MVTKQKKPKAIKYWVFDMDGTLTQAVHDFPAIRKALGIPPEADILAYLALLPEQERAEKNAWLIEHEKELAQNAKPAMGSIELVKFLKEQDYQLAILTRNDQQLAYITLQAIGLDKYFTKELVLGRDEAQPKPSPDGMLKLADIWQVAPENMLIIGDFLHDLASGKNAGTHTILVNYPNNAWPELVDWYYPNCQHLLMDLQQ